MYLGLVNKQSDMGITIKIGRLQMTMCYMMLNWVMTGESQHKHTGEEKNNKKMAFADDFVLTLSIEPTCRSL